MIELSRLAVWGIAALATPYYHTNYMLEREGHYTLISIDRYYAYTTHSKIASIVKSVVLCYYASIILYNIKLLLLHCLFIC